MNIVCYNCKVEKDISKFSKNKRKKYGVNTLCKRCFNEKYKKSKEEKKKYYNDNKEKWANYYSDNIETITEYKKEYKLKNSEKIKTSKREYADKNKDILKIKWKKYRDENKTKINEWFENNVEYRKEYKKEYQLKNKENRNNNRKNRRLNDKLYQLKENLRGRIYVCLKYNNHTKKSKTRDILGCSFVEFKIFLESKFESWMNWDNYGKYNGELNYGWDIDHIIPLKLAETEEDILQLCHYTNLQPLCSRVNRNIKSANLV